MYTWYKETTKNADKNKNHPPDSRVDAVTYSTSVNKLFKR